MPPLRGRYSFASATVGDPRLRSLSGEGARRKQVDRSADASTSSGAPGPLLTVMVVKTLRRRRAALTVGTPPRSPPDNQPYDLNQRTFCCRQQAMPAGRAWLRRPDGSTRGLHTGRSLPLDIPSPPSSSANRQAKHGFFQRHTRPFFLPPRRGGGLRWLPARLALSGGAGRLCCGLRRRLCSCRLCFWR